MLTRLNQKRLGISLVFLVFAFSQFAASAGALSPEQQDLFNENINYFNIDACGTSSGSTSTSQSVYILGDSITERATSAYQQALQQDGDTVNIDASTSRSLNGPGTTGNKLSGMDAITQDKSEIQQASAIVVALGTNGGDSTKSIDAAIGALQADNSSASIYWVDAFGLSGSNFGASGMASNNTAIYGEASSQNYQVISWAKLVDSSINPQKPDGNQTDANSYIDNSDGLGVHPTPAGSTALANLVTQAVSSSTNSSSGNSCCGSDNLALTGDTTGVEAYNFFIGKGLSPAAAAGIVGNLTEESIGVNPEQPEGSTVYGYSVPESVPADKLNPVAINDPTWGWGIAQWTPPGPKIIAYGKQQGVPSATVDTLAFQLGYLWTQVKGPSLAAGGPGTVLSHLKTATTPEDGATIFLNSFEGGNPSPSRQAYARAYYELATNNTPLPPNVPVTPASGSQASGGAASGAGCSSQATTSSYSGYQNPFRDVKNLQTLGIDAGVDYGGDGPVYAIGNGTVVTASNNSGWEGGHEISYKVSDGPAAGKTIYVAENCVVSSSLLQQKNAPVTSNTVLCTMSNNYPYIETGFAQDGSSTPLAYVDNCYYVTNPSLPKTSTAYGVSYNALMQSLGVPKASPISSQITCTLPTGWPSF